MEKIFNEVPTVEPVCEFREDILKLHIMYLEKLERLNNDERDAYTKYFYHLANPPFIVRNNGVDVEML